MRLQFIKGPNNCILINDAYNANPDSVIAGLEVLTRLAQDKTKVAVLGNMLEQGRDAVRNHRQVGEKAAQLGVDWLVTVGALAQEIASGAARTSPEIKVWSFRLKRQAIKFLETSLPPDSVVLVKGSRGAYMERVIRKLKEKA
jgi:UDP-N-acetylmuramoyl-tripeptide--D-alanyl-D-alanine ligase